MTIKSSKYQVYNGNTYDQLSFETLSKDVSITDADGLITATNVEDALQEIANKIGVLNGTGTIVEKANKSDLISHLADIMPHQSGLNSYASVVDANGIYTVIDYKRANGTLYMKSTLSGGTSPNYTTDTWKFYDSAGTTVIATKTWTIAYDANGKITSKVVA